MIIGAHVMLKSRDDVADKAFLTDILKLSSIDAGEGFLIFGLPPTEVAVHGAEQNDEHELYLMCESIEAFVTEMRETRRSGHTTCKSRLGHPDGGRVAGWRKAQRL